MFRVVIVDDEPWALVGFQRLLESREDRFKIILQTTDPVKALQVITKEHPEIVFTDIRMPEISGIELMKRTRAKGIEATFVVVSGFAEFSYAQQALQEGALDYLLKPMDMEKAKEMLEKLYRQLENKRSAIDLSFFMLLIEEKRDLQELLQTRLHGALHKRYQVAMVYFKNSEYDTDLFRLGDKAQSIVLKLGPQKSAFIFNSDCELGELIYNTLIQQEQFIDRAGISMSGECPETCSQLLKSADISCNSCFVDASKRILHYNNAKTNIVKQFTGEIISALEYGDYKNLKKLTSNMKAFFIDNGMGIEEVVFLWNQIVIYNTGNTKNVRQTLDTEFLDHSEIMNEFMNIEALSEYLYEQQSYSDHYQTGDANDNFMGLLDYVNKHYCENLYLKDLSNRFFINLSYCCELFKKATGMTFSQYTADLRIKKACALLQENALSITDICERVGYSEYFYFNKVFKKHTGNTPSKYRKTVVKKAIGES